MATLLDNATMQQRLAAQEAELHNAQIKERYRRLQDAENSQFNQSQPINATAYTVRASVLTPERTYTAPTQTPAVEQRPQVTEFVREEIAVSTATPVQTVQAPVQAINPVQEIYIAPTQAPVQTQAVAVEESYSLSRAAKMVMAAFAAVVVMLLTIIGINSGIIRQNEAYLAQLEQTNVALQQEYAELQADIAEAKSEDVILEYARSKGMNV